MGLRESLKEFTLAEKELRRVESKLEYYRTHPLASEHGVVKGSMKNYPYAEKSFKVSAPNVKSDRERKEKVSNLIITLEKRQEVYEKMLIDMDCLIETVQDTEMRIILQRYFIEKWTMQEIADDMGYERSTISKKIKAFT